MNYLTKSIKEFNAMMHKNDPETPMGQIPEEEVAKRIKIMLEEMNELCQSMDEGKPVSDIAKELSDVAYVLWGTISSYGLLDEFEKVFLEVHRSNMSKTYQAGNPKAVKGEGYTPADLDFLES